MKLPSAQLDHILAISFDLDDTLWDCAPVIKAAEATLYDWLSRQTPRITSRCTPEQIVERRMAFAQGHPEYRVDVSHMRLESLKALFSEFSYPRELAVDAYDVFYEARSRVALYEDAVPVLTELKQQYKLSAITNGNADLKIVGIEHLFDDIQLASLTSPPKPHRHMFDQSAAALGIEVHQILHVGDNPETDVGGAQSAGASAAWFNQFHDDWPDALQPADLVINNLITLTELLRKT